MFDFAECDGYLDLVFLIDVSGSIRRTRFQLVLQFIIDIVAGLDVHTSRVRVGLITFSDNSDVQFYLDTYDNRQDIMQVREH